MALVLVLFTLLDISIEPTKWIDFDRNKKFDRLDIGFFEFFQF